MTLSFQILRDLEVAPNACWRDYHPMLEVYADGVNEMHDQWILMERYQFYIQPC